ncbi:MAG: hypothetical protein AAGG68_30515 [Bacteroidota bacterium]
MFKTAGLRPSEIKELQELEAMGYQLNQDVFGFTAYVDMEVNKKLDTTIFDGLNEQLDIETYGIGVEKIGFAFIALAPKFFPENRRIEYFPDDKVVLMKLQLNYEKLIAASNEEAVEMMKQLYLRGVRVLDLFEIEDFDIERLYTDVENYLYPNDDE